MRARTSSSMGRTALSKPPDAGGGRWSTLGRRRSTSTAGVGCTSPKPSGRKGSRLAPTTQVGVLVVVVGAAVVGGDVVGAVGSTDVDAVVDVGADTVGDPSPPHAATRRAATSAARRVTGQW
jgi:hypothetical protein